MITVSRAARFGDATTLSCGCLAVPCGDVGGGVVNCRIRWPAPHCAERHKPDAIVSTIRKTS